MTYRAPSLPADPTPVVALREITLRYEKRDRPVTISSVNPSARVVSDASVPTYLNGSTATQKPSSGAAELGNAVERLGTGPDAAPARSIAANNPAKAAAVWGRPAGSIARTCWINPLNCAPTSGRKSTTTGGGSVRRRAMVRCGVAAAKGASPVSISNSTQPRLYKSLRPSSAASASACSGLMYAGVPTASPVWVSRPSARVLIAFAMPKSATTAWPLSRRMFSGLMSRWITPRAWA